MNNKQRSSKKGRLIRFLLKMFGFLIILAVLLVILAGYIVSSDWAKNLVIAEINNKTDMTLAVDKWSLNVFGRISCSDVTFDDGDIAASVEKVEIEFSTVGLIKAAVGDKNLLPEKMVSSIKNITVTEAECLIRDSALLKNSPANQNLKKQLLKISRGNFKMKRIANNTNITGSCDVIYDWQKLSSSMSENWPKNLSLIGNRIDKLEFVTNYNDDIKQLLLNLKATVGIGWDWAVYSGIEIGEVDTKIVIEKNIAKLLPFTAVAKDGGKVSFAGSLSLEEPMVFEITDPIQILDEVAINEDISNQLLMYVNPIFAKTIDVSGKIDLNCEKLILPLTDFNANDVQMISTIAIEQLQLKGSSLLNRIVSAAGSRVNQQNMRIRPTQILLANGAISYDDMQLDVGDNPINFRGTVWMDKKMDMEVILPYTLAGTTASTKKTTKGKRIILPIEGTVDQPELNIEKMAQQQLSEILETELLNQLEKLLN